MERLIGHDGPRRCAITRVRSPGGGDALMAGRPGGMRSPGEFGITPGAAALAAIVDEMTIGL